MMRREYVREKSAAATWSLRPAVFAPVLAIVATIAHRTGSLGTQSFLLVLMAAFATALAAFCLSLLGFSDLWRSSAIGGRRSALAMALSLPVLAPAVMAGYLSQVTAPLSDISTDTQDPPHFVQPLTPIPGGNTNEPPRLDGAIQDKFYPDLAGRRYPLSADSIIADVMTVIDDKGWQLKAPTAQSDGNADWVIEANVKSAIFGFVDDIVIRVTDEGEAAYVDMRSASRYGRSDLGANARRIADFMNDLDLKVQAAAGK
jgi:Protein of unknown function (DUF1499)